MVHGEEHQINKTNDSNEPLNTIQNLEKEQSVQSFSKENLKKFEENCLNKLSHMEKGSESKDNLDQLKVLEKFA